MEILLNWAVLVIAPLAGLCLLLMLCVMCVVYYRLEKDPVCAGSAACFGIAFVGMCAIIIVALSDPICFENLLTFLGM